MALNLHLLRFFATVAQTGSFSRAAEELHVSQPAISQGVRDFELQVGCRLLDRGARGVRPTREGEALLRHAKTLFAMERAAEEELYALRGLGSGMLRIGASTTIATYMIPTYLGIFHRAYPGVELSIISANTRAIVALLIEHAIDVALVEGPVEEPSIVSEAWRQDEMVLIASPDHAFANAAEPIDPARISEEIFIVREPGSGSREIVSEALSANKICPIRRLVVGSTEAIKQLVASGLGVAMVSVATIRDQISIGTIVVVPVRDLRIERILWRLSVVGRLSNPATVAFNKLIHL
ncbi:MAG: LysR family transcriptional regulator [Oxalobacteraceae bacterium]|uniref:LysR family transcriptional regulator n=1 Tax=Methylobacterium sp. V23 TaxID=2044878 RepID=UPI000CDB912C|nr:LysR family transcriptional regulator [Methylobacterium sp. V23]POR40447.1 LysR family transcriptional regulator [Methylobacterium sp. V23]RYF23642.1 MAG: LysR family transcriptional regulator [Oxalobacteraceae bacterium]